MTEAEKKAYLDRCTAIGEGAKAILEASQIKTADWVPFTQNVELIRTAIGVAANETYRSLPSMTPAASA